MDPRSMLGSISNNMQTPELPRGAFLAERSCRWNQAVREDVSGLEPHSAQSAGIGAAGLSELKLETEQWGHLPRILQKG